jgi:predicted RNA binding protein YcfA (HicA-like mRNA interferase family)
VTAAQVCCVLEKIGFALDRQRGSHRIYTDGAGHWVTVPYHAGRIRRSKTFKSILKSAVLTAEEFQRLCGKA